MERLPIGREKKNPGVFEKVPQVSRRRKTAYQFSDDELANDEASFLKDSLPSK